MGGLSFIHAGFLAGALAVAVPIAIHLLFRQKPRRVDIGSVWLLKAVLREHVRRRKIRRWLLLALRVAGVLLLALLFARPYRAGPQSRGLDQELVILIDQSASMAASSPGGMSAFDRAQAEAESLLKRVPDGAVVHLGYCDDSGVESATAPIVDRKRGAGFAGTDYGMALAWGRDLMLLSERANRKVVLLTDLQRSGLDRTEVEGWPPGVSFEAIDVGKPLTRGVALNVATPERPEIHAGEPFVISALVANTGLFAAENVPVQLAIAANDVRVTRTQSVTLDPGERRMVRFALQPFAPGLYQGSVSAEARDDFPLDDRRWLAFQARATDRVLVVDGDPGESVFSSATYYLETALRLKPPEEVSGSASPYVPVHATRNGAQGIPTMTGYPVVALCNVGEISDADSSALREYVVAGGRLLVFLGGRVTPGDGDRLRAARVLPAALSEALEEGSYRFTVWQKEHPLLSALADPQHGDLRKLVFRRIARLKPDPETRVLATAQTGDPLILEGSLGTGKILIFAFPADRGWGDWPVSRLYVPLIHQALGYLTDRLAATQPLRIEPTGPGPSNPPGVENQKNLVVTRNLEARESDGERIVVKELLQAYNLPQSETKVQKESSAIPSPPGSQQPDEYWRSVVWGLVAVLVIESFMANRTQA